MRAMRSKLIRDLKRRLGQVLAIAVVMGCGIATLVMSLTMIGSLSGTLDDYYEQARFAHVFASLKRAPLAQLDRVAEIPGVAQVEGRIVERIRLEMPGLPELASARVISLPAGEGDGFNLLHLREGRMPERFDSRECLVSEAFAAEHDLRPGSMLLGIMNGRRESFRVTGVALSPEFIYLISPGSILPDNERHGVLWMGRDELEAAFDMDGAFNDLLIRQTPGAVEADVIGAVDDLIERYGGLGAHGRDEQASHMFVSNEISELRGMAVIVPVIFLAVAAFLLNIVVTRLVASQREQIAVLKALGYSDVDLALHYLGFGGAILLLSAIVGIAGGAWMGHGLTSLYADYFKFPSFHYDFGVAAPAIGLLVGAGATVVGVLGALRGVLRLPPAEAMRPKPPATYRPTILQRLGVHALLSPSGRMIVRDLERRPIKTCLSVLGVAMAGAIVVVGLFFQNAMDDLIDFQFNRVQQYDVDLAFVDRTDATALEAVRAVPGVMVAEPYRAVPAEIQASHYVERTSILGFTHADGLHQLLDLDGATVPLPTTGLVLSSTLARMLNVGVGSSVRVHALDGHRRTTEMLVSGLVNDFSGKTAYAQLDHLDTVLREPDVVGGAYVRVDAGHAEALYAELREAPQVAAVNVKSATKRSFEESMAESLVQMNVFMVGFALAIAFGVIYNSAKISLSERSRDLATMRVLGFGRRDVAVVQLGELLIVTVLSLPPGMAIGYFLSWWSVQSMQSELMRIPFVIYPSTFGWASLVVIAASVVSGLIVVRNLMRLDYLSALKSRE